MGCTCVWDSNLTTTNRRLLFALFLTFSTIHRASALRAVGSESVDHCLLPFLSREYQIQQALCVLRGGDLWIKWLKNLIVWIMQSDLSYRTAPKVLFQCETVFSKTQQAVTGKTEPLYYSYLNKVILQLVTSALWKAEREACPLYWWKG